MKKSNSFEIPKDSFSIIGQLLCAPVLPILLFVPFCWLEKYLSTRQVKVENKEKYWNWGASKK